MLPCYSLCITLFNTVRTQVSDRTLVAVGEKTAQLSYLDITGCRAITDVGLSAVARNCRLLQTVSLKHCFRLTDASLVQLVQGTGLHLRALVAKDVRGISDQVLKAIAESCSQVRSLSLRAISLIGIPQLAYLNVTNCTRITDVGVKQLTIHCRTLRTISLSGCYAVSVGTSLAVIRD